MKSSYLNARSLDLPKGVPVLQFDTVQEILAHVKGNEQNLVDTINKYGRQKDCFPEALDLLSEICDTATDKDVEIIPAVKDVSGKVTTPAVTVKGLGFPMKMKSEKKGDKEVKSPDESNAEHITRWVKAQPDQKAAWNQLQGYIDQHGDFKMDLNAAVRSGKPRKLPDYLVEAATNIINGGKDAVHRWTERLTKGYFSEGFGDITPVAFNPFNVHPKKGATPEEVEAARKANIENLAKALVEVEEQKREMKKQQAKKEYA